MRWILEISTLGDKAPPEAHQVEAESWQAALEQGRARKGDTGNMSSFSIELLENGYRAINPEMRLRYEVRETKEGSSNEAAVQVAAPAMPAIDPEALSWRVPGEAEAPPAAVEAPRPKPVRLEILSQRSQEPTPEKPLIYQEVAFLVPADASESDAEALLKEELKRIRLSLVHREERKLVQLAAFEQRFEGTPTGRPLAALTWKDWKEDVQVHFPRRRSVPPPSSVGVPPVVAQPTDVSAPARAKTLHSEPPPAPAASNPADVPVQATAPLERAGTEVSPKLAARSLTPPLARSSRSQARAHGDDLIAELFEACSELNYQPDARAGALFIATLALDKIPSELALVSLYDINKREFVVVQHLGLGTTIVDARVSERAKLVAQVMRTKRTSVTDDTTTIDERWGKTGVPLRSIACAPVEVGGRYLGLIELANPLDGGAFQESDGHALTYIGQQFAEFLAERGGISFEPVSERPA